MMGRILFCWINSWPNHRLFGAWALLEFLLVEIHVFVVSIGASLDQWEVATVWLGHQLLGFHTFWDGVCFLLASVIKSLAILFQGTVSLELAVVRAYSIFLRGCRHRLIVAVDEWARPYDMRQIPPVCATNFYLTTLVFLDLFCLIYAWIWKCMVLSIPVVFDEYVSKILSGPPGVASFDRSLAFKCSYVNRSGSWLFLDHRRSGHAFHVLVSFFGALSILSLLLEMDLLFQMILVYCCKVDNCVALRHTVSINCHKMIIVSRDIDIEFQRWCHASGDLAGKMRSPHRHVAAPPVLTTLGHHQLPALHLLRDPLGLADSYFSLAHCQFVLDANLAGKKFALGRDHAAWGVVWPAHICFGRNCDQALVITLLILFLLLSPHSNHCPPQRSLLLLILIFYQR